VLFSSAKQGWLQLEAIQSGQLAAQTPASVQARTPRLELQASSDRELEQPSNRVPSDLQLFFEELLSHKKSSFEPNRGFLLLPPPLCHHPSIEYTPSIADIYFVLGNPLHTRFALHETACHLLDTSYYRSSGYLHRQRTPAHARAKPPYRHIGNPPAA
jgi:hypothetical protein